jgi:dTDP-4-dehydrorhamnose reductase
MKVLVIGASGQVGRSLVERLSGRGDVVVATFNSRRPSGGASTVDRLDKSDLVSAREVLERHRPEVVIDTGAMHNVDYCESHRAEAFRVNAEGTRAIAEFSRAENARFVFVSTDFVFDGAQREPYRETDPTRPVSVYAESKLAGEEATTAASPENLVVRPSVIYSWLETRARQESSSGKGINFGTWLAEEVAHGRSVRIIEDQTASPTLADDLAGAILALVDHHVSGVVHTAGATAINRFEFSMALVRRIGLDPTLVRPVRTAELHQTAKRPANSSLSSDRLAQATGYRMLDLPAQLDRFVAAMHDDPAAFRGRT